jgi:succinyl-CoA synthetase alpha subunit
MGHAGAIVSGSSGTAAAKAEALEAAGVRVGKTPSAAAGLMREIIQGG